MNVQREECGCYVARFRGRETHGESYADAIARMFAIMSGQAIDPLAMPL